MAGRKKIPTNLKVIKGTLRANRVNHDEPKPETCIPDPPEHLTENALIEWSRITVELMAVKVISNLDLAVLSAYCQAWSRVIKYEKIIAEKGELYKTTNGNIQISPAMSILNRANDQVYKFGKELGLSPSSRASVNTNKKEKKKDDWADFG